jgi:hypothetical protein
MLVSFDWVGVSVKETHLSPWWIVMVMAHLLVFFMLLHSFWLMDHPLVIFLMIIGYSTPPWYCLGILIHHV